jgi:hypothetical protein
MMLTRLADAWDKRDPALPYKNPYEALTMASIVEKETGQKSERAMIAGVFVNRLKIGMLLQTDPTVIYGMGLKYDGKIRKKDLETDTPYNTYTRRPAADADRLAGRAIADRRAGAGQDGRAVFRLQGQWHQPVLGQPERPQSGSQSVSTISQR